MMLIWNKSHLKLFQKTKEWCIWCYIVILCKVALDAWLGVVNCVILKFVCLWCFCCFSSELKKRYNITALPKLVIMKENGQVITDKGRKQIRDQGLACFRSWLEVAEIFQNFKGWESHGTSNELTRAETNILPAEKSQNILMQLCARASKKRMSKVT